MKWYAVHGRVPKDDDDTVVTMSAESVEDAKKQFTEEMRFGDSAEEIAACDEEFSSTGGVYILSVFESDTEIREVQ